jgi:ABC-type branched-subunit amino acid transport system ATPase component
VAAETGHEALVRIRNVSKAFGGVKAVNDVSLGWDAGKLYGLIGPNGAGKSTLINLVMGVSRPSAGSILVRDTDVTGWPTYRIARLGLARTFQTSILMEDETVLTNVLAGRDGLARQRGAQRARGGGDLDEVYATLDRFDLRREVMRRAGDLSHGVRRLVEVTRALVSGAQLVLLDEPAAGLPHADAHHLGHILREFTVAQARSIVLIEHNMRLVLESCSHITVLVEGAVAESGPPEVIRNSARVIESYLGKGPTALPRMENSKTHA